MNAPNVLPQKENAPERGGYEPSMEDILASIRRIISDEQTPGVPRATPEPAPVDMRSESTESAFAGDADKTGAQSQADAPQPTAAELAPAIGADKPFAESRSQAPPPAGLAHLAPESRAPFAPEPGREFRPVPLRPFAPERPVFSRIFASRLTAETSRPPVETFDRMETPRQLNPEPQPALDSPEQNDTPLISPAADTIVSQAFNKLVASRFLQSSDMMSGMVREMLKPMLKAWLDDNLPVLVERLVRAEIERVARGGR